MAVAPEAMQPVVPPSQLSVNSPAGAPSLLRRATVCSSNGLPMRRVRAGCPAGRSTRRVAPTPRQSDCTCACSVSTLDVVTWNRMRQE